MNRFVVISPDTEQIQERVQKHFPEHYEIMPGVWAISGANVVPSDISQVLGIDGSDNNSTGVVFRADAYNGFYHSALWEKLNAWERS